MSLEANASKSKIVVDCWDTYISLIKKYGSENWLFRGQKDSQWLLESNLERACKDYNIKWNELSGIEQGMIRKTYRHLFSYNINNIDKKDLFQILALMQHYGCPTRLLDFSHSPYVGLFFAIENACIDKYSTVWAINSDWLDTRFRKIAPAKYRSLLKNDPFEKSFEMMKFLLQYKTNGVKHVGPFYLNARITAQLGTFIIPMNIEKPFMDNLRYDVNADEYYKNVNEIVIHCTKDFLKEAYNAFHKMSITRATLFPGIDGFVSHMKTLMLVENAMAPPQYPYVI